MRPYRALLRGRGTSIVDLYWMGCIIDISGFDSRQAQVVLASGPDVLLALRLQSNSRIPTRNCSPQRLGIGGVVRGPNGPEAGVWVIAETRDLPVRYIKIVVTDDQGRYVVPDLPKANYDVWVRGYGLVDSPKVKSEPGKQLNLRKCRGCVEIPG